MTATNAWPYMLLVFFAGLSWPFQAAVNSELKSKTGQPLASAMVNGGGAAVLAGLALLAVGLWARTLGVPGDELVDGETTGAGAARRIPWWAYTGGFFSVLVIVAQSSSARPLGVALLITLFVAGQAVSSLTVDQFGLLGIPQRSASPVRVLAVALLLVCVGLLAMERRDTPATSTHESSSKEPRP